MRIVLDTNVWLSALFREREANKITELAEKKKFLILISQDILNEINKVLNKEAKFQTYLENKKQSIEELFRTVLSFSNLIKTKTKLNIIKEDISDTEHKINRCLKAVDNSFGVGFVSVSPSPNKPTPLGVGKMQGLGDNIILELALDGKADFIISYDNHLLGLREFQEIKIIKPEEFLNII